MSTSSKPLVLGLIALLTLVAALALMACEEYDPPPEARLMRSGEGTYEADSALVLEFSRPIEAESLTVAIWPSSRGTRRVPESDDPALVDACEASSCSEIDVEVSDNGREASLLITADHIGPGSNFVLEVLPGLRDRAGNVTGASYLFTVRFRAEGGEEEVEFDDGMFVLGGAVNNPMRAVLTLVTDVKVLPDGRFVMAGARGLVEEGADEMTRDPEEITVDDSEVSWAVFASGMVTQNEEGRQFLETDVFDVSIPVLGGSTFLDMYDVRISGEFVEDEDGNPFLDSVLTYESLTMTNMANMASVEYDGDSTELLGNFVPTALVPDGAPDICGSVCGNAEAGVCDPPADFPDPDFCAQD